jgi:hypothetical protein
VKELKLMGKEKGKEKRNGINKDKENNDQNKI